MVIKVISFKYFHACAWQNNYRSIFSDCDVHFKLYEGTDRVRGRGEVRAREGGEEEEGEEGAGGGRRGGGRREKRGREEGEGRKKGREGKRGKFCAREACAAQEGRRETRGRKGGGKGREGGEAYPPVRPLIVWQAKIFKIYVKLKRSDSQHIALLLFYLLLDSITFIYIILVLTMGIFFFRTGGGGVGSNYIEQRTIFCQATIFRHLFLISLFFQRHLFLLCL